MKVEGVVLILLSFCLLDLFGTFGLFAAFVSFAAFGPLGLCNAAIANEQEVNVSLFSVDREAGRLKSVEVLSPFRIISPASLRGHRGRLFSAESSTKNEIALAHKKLAVQSLVIVPLSGRLKLKAGSRTRLVSGPLKIRAEKGCLTIVDGEPLRQYLAAAVGSESPASFPQEALKAQAILVQSWLKARRSGIIDDTTNEICFAGEEAITPAARKAVDAVFGETLCEHGKVLKPYFHSTCAGGISDAQEIFSGKKSTAGNDNTSAVICKNCVQSPFYKEHRSEIPAGELARKLGYLPVRIATSDDCHRPLTVEVIAAGNSSTVSDAQDLTVSDAHHPPTVSGYDLWLAIGKNFGWGLVPGMRYRFERSGSDFVFISSGAGHGAGLCQWGSCGLAKHKSNYKEILHFYFPKAEIVKGAIK